MITEDTIKQTKFYMGADGKCYLVRDVRTVKMVSLIYTMDGSESDLLLGDDICSQFEPAEASFEPFIQNQVVAQKSVIAKPQPPGLETKPGPSVFETKNRTKTTKYKGVSRLRTKKDGTQRYMAQVWDGKKKKNIRLGPFDSPEIASAAYEKYVSEMKKPHKPSDEVRRKTDLQEQEENNPDRPTKTKKKKIWICKNKACKLEWQSLPDVCPGCKGTAFDEGEED